MTNEDKVVDWDSYLNQVHRRRPDKEPPQLLPRGCYHKLNGCRWLLGCEIIRADLIPRHPADYFDGGTINFIEREDRLPQYRTFMHANRTSTVLRLLAAVVRCRKGLRDESQADTY